MNTSADSRTTQASDLVDEEWIAGLVDQAMDSGVTLDGQGGLIQQVVKAVIEKGLAAELDDHLGYEKGDPAGVGSGNSRNGTSPKTVGSSVGTVRLAIPRDRNGTFTPQLVAKGQRRLEGLEDQIVSLYAHGMTTRDISRHLHRTLGVELSRETISKITDAVTEEVLAWQSRPLDALYPVVFLDALVVKVVTNHKVINKAAHIVVGVDTEGIKHVLGIWIAEKEGAAFWARVCADLANRGVKDIIIACCDGLSGFADAIAATFQNTTVQTCVVHLIRAAMRFVAYADRKDVAAALKPVYTAVGEREAELALDAFTDSELGRKYPAATAVWINAWDRFIPFLEFPPELRKVVYTTNAIESMNFQFRKVIKNRGHFPSDESALKILWLALTNIEANRADERAAASHDSRRNKDRTRRIIEGTRTNGWPAALAQLAVLYPDRMAGHIN